MGSWSSVETLMSTRPSRTERAGDLHLSYATTIPRSQGPPRAGRYPEHMTRAPDSSAAHLVLAYLRPVDGEPPLDPGVQHLAIAAACRGEGLVEVATFEEANAASNTAFLALVEALRDQPPGTGVIVASAPVFAD